MKKIIFSAVAVAMAICTAATAQAQDLTYGAKVGVDIPNVENAETQYVIGATAEYGLSDVSAISADLQYVSSFKEDYPGFLELPILYNYSFFEGFAVKAGIAPSYGISNVEDDKFSLSIPVGVSYYLENGVGLDVRYNIGTKDEKKGGYSSFAIAVGYKF